MCICVSKSRLSLSTPMRPCFVVSKRSCPFLLLQRVCVSLFFFLGESLLPYCLPYGLCEKNKNRDKICFISVPRELSFVRHFRESPNSTVLTKIYSVVYSTSCTQHRGRTEHSIEQAWPRQIFLTTFAVCSNAVTYGPYGTVQCIARSREAGRKTKLTSCFWRLLVLR